MIINKYNNRKKLLNKQVTYKIMKTISNNFNK